MGKYHGSWTVILDVEGAIRQEVEEMVRDLTKPEADLPLEMKIKLVTIVDRREDVLVIEQYPRIRGEE